MCLQVIELTEAEAKQGLPEIHGKRYYKLISGGEEVVRFSVWKNCYHERNTYIQPYFFKSQIDTKKVFSFLRDFFASPLQCMLSSDDERAAVLLSGGFKLARRCFEREYTKAELKDNITTNDNVAVYTQKDKQYCAACKLLYKTYAKNHESINPLTAGFDEFCKDLPQTVYCDNDRFAFTEENEICYVGGSGDLKSFFAVVLDKIFSEYQSVLFEADNVDAAAMQLKNMFNDTCEDSFDTYIYRRKI